MAHKVFLAGLILFWYLSIFTIVPPVIAEGRVEHHRMSSKILTISTRKARAIAGHSYGGGDSILMALSCPDMFSLVGTYSANFLKQKLSISLLKNHDQGLFPLRFWIYVAKNDGFQNIPIVNQELINLLTNKGLPHINIEDDGNH